MSAIDWEAKPEPWRTMGLQFVAELSKTAASKPLHHWVDAPRKRKMRVAWTREELTELMRLRDVEGLSWADIGRILRRRPPNARSRYGNQKRLEAGLT